MIFNVRFLVNQVLAKEEPNVRVLNYAPGPADTDMLAQLKNDSWAAEELGVRHTLTTESTCNRLVDLLANDSFTSGEHIDYFD